MQKKITIHPVLFHFIFCILLVITSLPVFGQTQNSIEQDPDSRTNPNQVTSDVRTRLPQRTLERVVPVEMLERQLVTVPLLVGRNYNFDEIVTLLDRYQLQLGRAVPVANNDNIGIIISQSPDARQRVRPQTLVNITYGIEVPDITPDRPQTISVPNYVGLSIERAEGRMPDDRLIPGIHREVHSEEQPGIVVNQFPKAGTNVDPETEVSLDISIGVLEEFPVRVPRLVGLTLKQAAEVLQEAELFVGNINEQVSDEREGIIIRQSPQEQTEVLRGSVVNITYSTGIEEELVVVPDVTGMLLKDAIQILKANKLNYAQDFVRNTNQRVGIVTGQDVSPGQRVKAGTMVVIQIQDNNAVPPWIYWGGGVLVAAFAGGFIGWKINPGRKKKIVGKKDASLELKSVWDPGKQTIICTKNNLIQNRIHFKYISDSGTQTLKTN